MITIAVKLDPGAVMPTRAHVDDVGYDVRAIKTSLITIENEVHPLEDADSCERMADIGVDCYKLVIETGVHVQPQTGYYLDLVPNSRLGKSPFVFANSLGVIDPGYTGGMKIILDCIADVTPDDLKKFLPGSVVGQLIVREKLDATFVQVDTLIETKRGENGFGSTEHEKTHH